MRQKRRMRKLNGFYVNLEYPLPNGQYLGNQIEIQGSGRCYGIVADEKYLLVCEYGCGGADPQIVVYKRRQARNSVCEELK